MDDRRHFQRWECSVPCRFSISGHAFQGCVVNLSFNGARVEADGATPAVDSRVMATLNPGGDGEDVEIPARVIYATEDCYGLLFEDSREELVRKLMPFFRAQIDEPDPGLELDEAS
ncbi:MAG: PilZ domain-containing protein [Acidobacteriota bacterium]